MNTIQNRPFNNTVNFGMKYKSPEKWGRKTLQTFIDSQLKEDIDKKYPNAVSSYKLKTKKVSGLFERREYAHSVKFELELEQGKKWGYKNTTLNTPDLIDDMLSKKINQTSLADIELDIEKEQRIKTDHKEYIAKAKAENENRPSKIHYKDIIKLFFGLNK